MKHTVLLIYGMKDYTFRIASYVRYNGSRECNNTEADSVEAAGRSCCFLLSFDITSRTYYNRIKQLERIKLLDYCHKLKTINNSNK